MVEENETAEQSVYKVVINEEGQYSIWPEYRDLPNGWRAVGREGPKKECLDYIDKVWTDMRPLSLRQALDGTQPNLAPGLIGKPN